MYQFEKTTVQNGFHFKLKLKEQYISWQNVFHLIESDQNFIPFFAAILKTVDFDAYFFECKSVSIHNLDSDFEFVLLNSNALASKKADFNTFSAFYEEGKLAVSFLNLGKDALLIAPTPNNNLKDFAHLANFIKYAETQQIQDFWTLAFKKLAQKINEKPLWFSTNGLGVFWLHLRIDVFPKYYQHAAFR